VGEQREGDQESKKKPRRSTARPRNPQKGGGAKKNLKESEPSISLGRGARQKKTKKGSMNAKGKVTAKQIPKR